MQDIVPYAGGYTWGGDEPALADAAGLVRTRMDTLRSGHDEGYWIAGVAVSRRVTTRDTPNAPPYPALLYRLDLEVSRRDHVFALVVPAAALALLSFVPFFMRAEGGARLGLGRIVALHCRSSTLYRSR